MNRPNKLVYSSEFDAMTEGNFQLKAPQHDGVVQIDAIDLNDFTQLDITKIDDTLLISSSSKKPLQAEHVTFDRNGNIVRRPMLKEPVETITFSKLTKRALWIAGGENVKIDTKGTLRRFAGLIGVYGLAQQKRDYGYTSQGLLVPSLVNEGGRIDTSELST